MQKKIKYHQICISVVLSFVSLTVKRPALSPALHFLCLSDHRGNEKDSRVDEKAGKGSDSRKSNTDSDSSRSKSRHEDKTRDKPRDR